jgi:bacillithiol system protein YtxJ
MPIHWIDINQETSIGDFLEASCEKPVFLFKHSYRCSISTMAKSRLERSALNAAIYLVDVVKDRPVSQALAEILGIQHESPQLLVVSNKTCTFWASHSEIHADMLKPAPVG